MSPLDRLPAWLRHALIAFVAAYIGTILDAVITAHGVTLVAWPNILVTALDAAALATAVAISTLYLTPITKQYGVGHD